jgi:hypothetical protein
MLMGINLAEIYSKEPVDLNGRAKTYSFLRVIVKRINTNARARTRKHDQVAFLPAADGLDYIVTCNHVHLLLETPVQMLSPIRLLAPMLSTTNQGRRGLT